MIAQDHALEQVLVNWDNLELSVETRLNSLRDYILKKAGLDKSIEYYQKEGKMLERYAAGFINRYFIILKDVSFILLDPLHILDILWAFLKNIFRHPLQTAKRIWAIWTKLYHLGSYGLGMLTADALIAALIAGVGILFRGGQALEVVAEATSTFGEAVTNAATTVPRKVLGLAQKFQTTVEGFDQFVGVLQREPELILASAKETIQGTGFSDVRKYKLYTQPFRGRDTLA